MRSAALDELETNLVGNLPLYTACSQLSAGLTGSLSPYSS